MIAKPFHAGSTTTETILIIDSDLGFVFWLGQLLDQAGYQALPAKSVADASELLSHWGGSLDAVIISPNVSGSIEFAAHLRALNPNLRVISLTDQDNAGSPAVADFVCVRSRDAEAQAQWLDIIANITQPTPKPTVSRAQSC